MSLSTLETNNTDSLSPKVYKSVDPYICIRTYIPGKFVHCDTQTFQFATSMWLTKIHIFLLFLNHIGTTRKSVWTDCGCSIETKCLAGGKSSAKHNYRLLGVQIMPHPLIMRLCTIIVIH